MEEFIEFLKEGLSELVTNGLNASLPLLNESASTTSIIIEIVATFVIQLLIFLVLFLVVRFKFWNLVTNFIESRQKQVDDAIAKKDDAEAKLEALEIEASTVIDNSKKRANEIIEDARKVTLTEVASIKQEAFEEIEQEKNKAKEQLAHERAKMEEQIKEEIVDVALEISKNIVGREIDQNKNQDIIDDALSKLGDNND